MDRSFEQCVSVLIFGLGYVLNELAEHTVVLDFSGAVSKSRLFVTFFNEFLGSSYEERSYVGRTTVGPTGNLENTKLWDRLPAAPSAPNGNLFPVPKQ